MNTEEMTEDEIESKIGELELMHEDLEQTYHVHVCALLAVILHLLYHNWILTIVAPIILLVAMRKFMAKKLFTNGTK